jgi:hypothetical protein
MTIQMVKGIPVFAGAGWTNAITGMDPGNSDEKLHYNLNSLRITPVAAMAT